VVDSTFHVCSGLRYTLWFSARLDYLGIDGHLPRFRVTTITY